MNAETSLSDEPANLAKSVKQLVAGGDYFRDVYLHRQLTVKMNAEITDGLHMMDHRGARMQRQIGII